MHSEKRPLSNSVAFQTLFKWHRYCGILKIHIVRKINTGIRYEPVYRPALSCALISAILACKIREATYLCFNWKRRFYQSRAEQSRHREREMCARWERETSRSCGSQLQIHNIFICYKQDTQEARWHADSCHGNKYCEQQQFAFPHLMHISYMKSILRGPWLLGAQGSHLPLPNG